jgi:hypothetical protein
MSRDYWQAMLELKVFTDHYEGLLKGNPRDLAIMDTSRTRIDRDRGLICFNNGDSIGAFAGPEMCTNPAEMRKQFEVEFFRVEAYWAYQQVAPVVSGAARIADLVAPGLGEIPDMVRFGSTVGSDLLNPNATSQLPMTGLRIGLTVGAFFGGPVVAALAIGTGVYLEMKHAQSAPPKLNRPNLYAGLKQSPRLAYLGAGH